MNDRSFLFMKFDLGDTLGSQEAKIPSIIDRLSQDQLLATPEADLIVHLVAEEIIEPIKLHENAATMSKEETKIDVTGDRDRYFSMNGSEPHLIPGTQVEVTIPFTGSVVLWECRPSTWRSTFPQGTVQAPYHKTPGYLNFKYTISHDADPVRIKKSHEENMDDVHFYLDNVNKEVDAFNQRLTKVITDAIIARKARIEKHDGLSQMLGIPLHVDPTAPSLKPIQVDRKLVKPLPPPPASGYKAEPGITDDIYEFILDVIRHEGRTFEGGAKTFGKMGEDELRDVVLAHLNGHFKGDATAETFRMKGKTDIRIEEDNRAAFVAECKLWGGSKIVSESIDQLAGYLTWRDCKASLVIFNTKVAGFTKIREKVPEALNEHPLFKRMEETTEVGEWRVIFQAKEDELREIKVHVFLFDLHIA